MRQTLTGILLQSSQQAIRQDTVILIRRPAMETKPVLEKGLKFPVWNEAVFLHRQVWNSDRGYGKTMVAFERRWLTLNWIIWLYLITVSCH